jgi:hypothetical protein
MRKFRRWLPWVALALGAAFAAVWLRSRGTYDRVDFGYVARHGELHNTVIWAEFESFRGRYSILMGGRGAFYPRAGLPPEAEGKLLFRRQRHDATAVAPYWASPYPRGFLGFHFVSYERWPTPDGDPIHPGYRVVLPHWSLILLFVAWPALRTLRWLRSRSALEGRLVRSLCPACGYDLRATPGRCPECGQAAERPAAPAAEPTAATDQPREAA